MVGKAIVSLPSKIPLYLQKVSIWHSYVMIYLKMIALLESLSVMIYLKMIALLESLSAVLGSVDLLYGRQSLCKSTLKNPLYLQKVSMWHSYAMISTPILEHKYVYLSFWLK